MLLGIILLLEWEVWRFSCILFSVDFVLYMFGDWTGAMMDMFGFLVVPRRKELKRWWFQLPYIFILNFRLTHQVAHELFIILSLHIDRKWKYLANNTTWDFLEYQMN